jgi:hypothetical protein
MNRTEVLAQLDYRSLQMLSEATAAHIGRAQANGVTLSSYVDLATDIDAAMNIVHPDPFKS